MSQNKLFGFTIIPFKAKHAMLESKRFQEISPWLSLSHSFFYQLLTTLFLQTILNSTSFFKDGDCFSLNIAYDVQSRENIRPLRQYRREFLNISRKIENIKYSP